jgi:hypothetical protein
MDNFSVATSFPNKLKKLMLLELLVKKENENVKPTKVDIKLVSNDGLFFYLILKLRIPMRRV